MSKKDIDLDAFHYHEALDRAYLIGNCIGEYLRKHPVIYKHKELKKKIKKAENLLVEVYQEISGLQERAITGNKEDLNNENNT